MKILTIVGPTSSGKTSLGLKLADIFNGELVSADSRQVYKDLDIGTGKDIPENSSINFVSKKVGGYYIINGVKVWGYDLVEPTKKYSVSKYIKDAKNIIQHIHKRGKLPILVGGTGFYIKGLVDGIDTAHIPRNPALRKKLKNFSIEKMFESLANIAPEKAGNMNISDKKNPRRLIRAIEIAQWKMENKDKDKIPPLDGDFLVIGLRVDKKELDKRIKQRIQNRLENGFEDEIKQLLMSGVGWDEQSMQALGYKQWQDYLKGDISKEEGIKEWYNAERKYAKKQMTWFKKEPRIEWFGQENSEWKEEVLQLVDEWLKQNETSES